MTLPFIGVTFTLLLTMTRILKPTLDILFFTRPNMAGDVQNQRGHFMVGFGKLRGLCSEMFLLDIYYGDLLFGGHQSFGPGRANPVGSAGNKHLPYRSAGHCVCQWFNSTGSGYLLHS